MTKKKKPAAKTSESNVAGSDHPAEERLQKALAAAGIGSRRQCEELILEGRVEIDGQVAQELGVKVDPRRQEIRVDGTRLARPSRRYYVVNKPVGVVCTDRDPAGRMRLVDLLPTEERLFSVGRLDRASEGMILLTNDGDFANRLAHPRYGVHKTYRVIVAGRPEPAQLKQLTEGVHLAEGVARADSVRVKKMHKDSADLEIVLSEGKNREIRRVLARIGHKVLRLKRVAIGSVKLADLPTGQSRRLTQQEVRDLLGETERRTPRSPSKTTRKRTPSGRSTERRSRSSASEPTAARVGTILTFESESGQSSGARQGRKATARRLAGRSGSPKAASKSVASKRVSAGQGRPARPSLDAGGTSRDGKRAARGALGKSTPKRKGSVGGAAPRKSGKRGGGKGRR